MHANHETIVNNEIIGEKLAILLDNFFQRLQFRSFKIEFGIKTEKIIIFLGYRGIPK